MLAPRIIPCLDVSHGRVVKGVRFQGMRDAGDPAERAALYEAQGADEIVILDVSATPEGRGNQVETVQRVRARLGIPLTVGGGVRRLDDASTLLEAGADKVSVNTAAVQEPALLGAIAERFGRQCTVLAIDAARRDGRFEVLIKGGREGTGIDAALWAHEAAQRGAGEILLTSWDRDGTRAGYDLELIRAVREAANVPVIASGGAAGPEHLREAFEAGADAVLAASIFHDGDLSVADLKRILIAQGLPLRP
jgi:cyclase